MGLQLTRRVIHAWLLCGAALVVACGGGGGSEPAAAATAPTITAQPQSATVLDGQSASFGVTASGTTPLTYQWRRNGSDIAGATASAYTVAAATLADSGASFTVQVSNGAGPVTSNVATLTVNPVAPAIATQPTNISVPQGQTATFAVVATGSATLSYQWRRNGIDVAGATAATYTTAATALADSGAVYTVVVVNGGGTVTSDAATLTVTAMGTPPTPTPPTITASPANVAVSVGQAATFTVAAAGTAPFTYQWRRNGVDIPGANAFSYTTPATTAGDNGAQFSVVVSNSAGGATSSTATPGRPATELADDRYAARQCERVGGPIGDVQRHRDRRGTAGVPVATQRRGHCRRHRGKLHHAGHHGVGQRRAVLGRGVERRWCSDECGGDAGDSNRHRTRHHRSTAGIHLAQRGWDRRVRRHRGGFCTHLPMAQERNRHRRRYGHELPDRARHGGRPRRNLVGVGLQHVRVYHQHQLQLACGGRPQQRRRAIRHKQPAFAGGSARRIGLGLGRGLRRRIEPGAPADVLLQPGRAGTGG
jgi:Immunoglobulin I-set domain